MGRRISVAEVLLLAIGIGACGRTQPLQRQLVDTPIAAAVDARSKYLKVHTRDGHLYVLTDWKLDDPHTLITGSGRLMDVNRYQGPPAKHQIQYAQVALLETNVQLSGQLVGMSVLTGASLVVTAACLLNPKSCFGSCPTFYVSDGQRPLLQAEGFSDSIAPSLEATDVDALFRARPQGRALTVRMTNEALETHVVRRVQVLAAPRPPGGRVFHAGGEALYQADHLRAPERCSDARGESCLDPLAAFDEREWMSRTDPDNLATREDVELAFAGDAQAPQGLVIAARQTFVTTFLLYQAFAYLGSRATEALATLERGDRAMGDRLRETQRLLGGIEVWTQAADGGGAWQRAGEVFETGPIATDVHLLPLPALPPGTARIKLRLGQGHWRLDWVALVRLGARVQPLRLAPSELRTIHSGDRPAAVNGQTVVSLPGDAYEYHYQLPAEPERYELFLESRGYYLEWMRQEWEKEESQWRAALMLYQPGLALRWLAPAFKKVEPEIERLFWESRYVRR
ncbi:MAG TPA: hypothetical protein VFH68_19760 [Polyangia bacterium]|nr:hypothetical protein [Polyangia bacterium]